MHGEIVATDEMLRRKAEEGLRKSEALRVLFDREITAEQLQRELDRMAAHTKDPALLRALFAALGHDPVRIAESLVRPILADRLLRRAHGAETFDGWWDAAREQVRLDSYSAVATLTLPEITGSSCDDAWSPTFSDVPAGMGPASWTGTEMIFWGDGEGSRYDPATDSWTVISRFGAPSRRTNHTAVWTGTEMIVWGGHRTAANEVFFDTGARYSPATDTWTPMSVAGAPTGRRDHSAVWTGSQMIVWGGQGPGNTLVQTGGRYSPATDTWTATTTTGAPAATSNHTAVWTGSQMIVWGDTGGARYTPSSNTWSVLATNDAPALRTFHTAVWTGSEMIVWGGLTGTGITQTGARYAPQMNKWRVTTTTGAPAARFQHGAVWTGTHMVVFGGNGNTGGRYSPQSDSWLPVATTGAPGGDSWTDPAMAWTGTEVLVYAGQGGRYDPSGNAWSTLTVTGQTPSPRLGPTAVWTGAELVLWGGIESVGNTVLGTGARYLPALDAWLPVTTVSAPLARRNHKGVWTGTEMIVWGGDNPTVPGGYLDTGARYDPLTETWTPTTTAGAPSARRFHTATWAGTRMMVWGGENAPQPAPFLATGGLYDPATNTWSPTSLAGAPTARVGHTAVWTGSEVIVWGGGAADGQPSARGARYVPATGTWTATPLPNAPAPTSGHSAVWTGSDMIVFGGTVGADRIYRPSTSTWIFLQGQDGLGLRANMATVWSGIHMIAWGGSYPFGNGSPSKGSRYNAAAPLGAAWSLMSELGAPNQDINVVAAWTGQSLVVWGGGSSTGGVYCSCHEPATLYRDADGDGYGTTEPGFSFTGCGDAAPPAGYVFAGGDCNDASTAVIPASPRPATASTTTAAARPMTTPTGSTPTWTGSATPAIPARWPRTRSSTMPTTTAKATCATPTTGRVPLRARQGGDRLAPRSGGDELERLRSGPRHPSRDGGVHADSRVERARRSPLRGRRDRRFPTPRACLREWSRSTW